MALPARCEEAEVRVVAGILILNFFCRAKLQIIPHMDNYYTLNNCNLAVAHRPSCLRPGAALADKADPHVLAAK